MATTKTTKKNGVFANVTTLVELEQAYIDLLMTGNYSEEDMKSINALYDVCFETLKAQHNSTAEEYKKVHENPEEMRTVVTQILTYKDAEKDLDFMRDCKVDLVGTWLWVRGKEGKDPEITRKYSDFLNSIKGFRWNGKSDRKVWQWHSPSIPWRPYHNKKSIPQTTIYNTYGSKELLSADEI